MKEAQQAEGGDGVKAPLARLRDPRALAAMGAAAAVHAGGLTALLWPITNADPVAVTGAGLALAGVLRHTAFRRPRTLYMCSLVGHCDFRDERLKPLTAWSPRLEGAVLVFAGTLAAIPSVCIGAAITGGALLWGIAALGMAADGVGQFLAGELSGLGEVFMSFMGGSLFLVVGALPVLPVGTSLAVVDRGTRLLLQPREGAGG